MKTETQSRIRNALDKNTTFQEGVKHVPQSIYRFNWGACILAPIWGIFNNSPIACITLLLGAVPFAGIILSMIFSLYCGSKGNEWAWTNKEWKSEEQFHFIQRKWAIAAIIIELVILVLFTISALKFLNAINNFDFTQIPF